MDEDERNLLTACAANPADDLPRLVFADWLDENGEPERAEFVRLQVEAAKPDADPVTRDDLLRRAGGLLDAHRGGWEEPLRTLGVAEVGYRRGLPVTVALPPEAFLAHGHALADHAPTLARARFTPGEPAAHRAVAANTALIHLTGVAFSTAGLGDAGVSGLAANPAAVGLRHLAVRWDVVGDPGARALAASPRLAALETLDLFGNRLTPHAVRHLLDGPHLRRLTGLDLGGNPLGDAGARAIASARPRGSLTALGLIDCDLGAAGARRLLTGSGLPALTELDLGDNPLGDAGARAIAASPRAGRLTRLNLRHTGVGPAGLRALADSRFLGDDLVMWVDGFAGRCADFRAWVRGPGQGASGGRGR